MRVVYHPECLLHDPPFEILSGRLVPYYESPARVKCILKELRRHPKYDISDVLEDLDTEQYILAVHSQLYLDYIKTAYDEWIIDGGDKTAVFPETFPNTSLAIKDTYEASELPIIAKAGLYCFDLSCPITSTTYTASIRSVQVALTAAAQIARMTTKSSLDQPGGIFALCRPPGHHAGTSICGGYCFFNNVSIAARYLQGISNNVSQCKIAVLDLDYHHGNGTQQIFYSDNSVLYISLHCADDYPYFTGRVSEIGEGKGQGFNINIPLPADTEDNAYCKALKEAIHHIQEFDAAFLIVSLGLDTYIEDPICRFKITNDGYGRIGRLISEINLRTLFVMEGGYHLETLGANVHSVLSGFLGLV